MPQGRARSGQSGQRSGQSGQRSGQSLQQSRRSRSGEGWLQAVLFACAAAPILVSAVGLSVLVVEAVGFVVRVDLAAMLREGSWHPFAATPSFGFGGLLWASVQIAGGALLITLPTALAFALHVEEYADRPHRALWALVAEALAALPSIVVALVLIVGIAPWLDGVTDPRTAALLLATLGVSVLALPETVRLLRQGIRAVPEAQRLAAFSLGATRGEVVRHVVLPALRLRIPAGGVLAIGRALGEATLVTLVVAQVVPNGSVGDVAPLALTDGLVRLGLRSAPQGTLADQSLFALALVLLLLTVGGHLLARRYLRRERSEAGA